LVPGRRLCEAGRNRQPRHPSGAAEAEHRHACDVGAETHPARDAGFETWRGNAGGADGDDRVDIGSHQICARQRLLGGIDEQRLSTLQKGLGPFRPASRREIPVERLDAVAFDDAGIAEDAGEGFEFGKPRPEHFPRRGENILLQKHVGRDGCCQRDQSRL